jgi:hypothetical protein
VIRPGPAFVLICLTAAGLPGCASGPAATAPSGAPGIAIEGLVIRNDLAYSVTDVMIDVPATGAFAGCGNILARSECRTTFQQIDYRGNGLVVSWKEHGQPQKTDEFVVRPPTDASPGDAFMVEVVVFAPGQAGARLVDVNAGKIRSR